MKLFFTFFLIAFGTSASAQFIQCYEDNDHDGYGNPNKGHLGTAGFNCQFYGWVSDGSDCDDNNASVNPGVKWYRDADGDGYHNNTYLESCVDPGPAYYLLTDVHMIGGNDCNDSDPSLNPGSFWGYDNDGDGYFSDYKTQCQSPGLKWVLASGRPDDCNDNDPAIHGIQDWYLDQDNDGYPGSLAKYGPDCTAPAHYRPASQMITTSVIDCNDQNPAVTNTRVYKDVDGDGYTNGTFLNWCFGTGINPPWKYTTTPVKDGSGNIVVDCDDSDPVENNPFKAWFTDTDGDKHGVPFPALIQCDRPAGYFALSELEDLNDCDGTNPSVWQSGPLYIDNDGDGWDNGQQTKCYGNVPTGFALTSFGSDCNDNDPQVHSQNTFYWDDDHDGYGDPNNQITLCALTPPRGYVGNGNDCDDDNAQINPSTIWYKDVDHDGYSDGANQNHCTRPAGYKLSPELTATSGDCDDNNAGLNPGTIWYKDADNDGFSDGSPQTQCTRPTNYKLPSELTATTGDCDDNSPILNPATPWYKDLDNDGYSDGTTVSQCAGPPGYQLSSALIATSGDCNDNNAAVNPATVWYKDADNDGYSDGATITQCARPANYKLSSELTATTGDCNEANAAVNPGIVLTITAPAAKTVNADAGKCFATNVSLGTPVFSNNCAVLTVINNAPSVFQKGQTVVIWTVSDGAGHSGTASQTVTVLDNQQPVITGAYSDVAVLFPPNHKMKDVIINYTATDICGAPTTILSVGSNEPIGGTGDGDVSPDWEVIDNHHVRLRAEKSRVGDGRIYTITITATDAGGNTSTSSVTVRVAHNITSPPSGQPFKIGSTVNFTGTFWDKPTNKHTANWTIDDNTTVKGTVTEPTSTKNGTVAGSYKFTTPGVYKLQMNTIDQNNVVSYANTNGDLEEIIVIYDPNGGYAYGGGWFNSPAGALTSAPQTTGKVSYGFSVNYYKGATLPKGETQFELKVGDLEYNALNFEYLSVNGYKAVFKGSGKIIGGQSGINFIMYVTDGALDATGVDKIRVKIYNKNTGQVYYDNQLGASDTADPVTTVGAGSTVVISGSAVGGTNTITQAAAMPEQKMHEALDVRVIPNPTSTNFSITLKGFNNNREIKMSVVDMCGRIIEHRMLPNEQTITIGDKYRPGVYVVRFTQGEQSKEFKLIKLPN